MDKGRPFRVSQSADRRVVSRPDRVRQQSEEPTPDRVRPQAPAGESKQQDTSSSKKNLPNLVGKAIVAVILIGALSWLVWTGVQGNRTAIDSDKYQAVFFTNGQVYFGKLESFNRDYMRLTNVYYLQNQQSQADDSDSDNPQDGSSSQGEVQLIKLGEEIHGPEDEMIISRDQILFYENLKEDGGVARSITEHQSNN